ncbi:hypothetical protein FHY11_002741 [Xanthomonas arboricola]|nr:hypothetical protein [Xanthomonas euroxanthea]
MLAAVDRCGSGNPGRDATEQRSMRGSTRPVRHVCLCITPLDIAIMIGVARVYLFTCLSSVDANVAASMTHAYDPHH